MTLSDWLKQDSFTLTLSSGYFSFFVHAGLVSALQEAGVKPIKITGCSAGAMVGAGWASGHSGEEMLDFFSSLDRNDFWDPSCGWGLLQGELFRDLIRQTLSAKRLEECEIPCTVSAFELERRKVVLLDKGELASAVNASCAVPGLFQPVLRGNAHHLDGAVGDPAGLLGTERHERIFFHQINDWLPWRLPVGVPMPQPKRTQMKTLRIKSVPQCGITKLKNGRSAYYAGYEMTKRALDAPVQDKMVLKCC